jgi:hypothetical protein
MQAGVPAALRRAALARIWSLDPAIRDFREMADYDWDFNVAGGAPGFGPLEMTADDVEQLLARVFPPAPAPAPEAAAEPVAPEIAPLPPAEPVRLAGPPPAPAPAVEEPVAEPVARPRRHGGAVPA